MWLIVMKGLPGTGKSALGRALSKQAGWPIIDKEAGYTIYDPHLKIDAAKPLEDVVKEVLDRLNKDQRNENTAVNTPHTTAAIILAAGASTRMGGGRHKLLLPLGDRPVLSHVLDAALASRARPIVLVLGYQAERVRALIPMYTEHPDITIIDNPDYLQGMSTSMKLGIQALLSLSGYRKAIESAVDSALFLTGDQPLITAEIIDSVIEAFELSRQVGKRIVAPLYDGQRGNPVLFDASLFTELLEVTGDEGGRSLLKRHPHEVATIETGNEEASYDVDTWEAYQQVLRAWEKR